MKRFTELYERLDATTRTNEKVRALVAYFRDAPAEDAAWALAFLTGRRLKRAVSGSLLRQLASERTGEPLWLIEECHASVGDLSETIALLLPENEEPAPIALHELVEERIIPLTTANESEKRPIIERTWAELGTRQRFVFHKLLSGSFRVGVQRRLVTRALAEVAGVEPAVMAHRLAGEWRARAEDFWAILEGDGAEVDPARPYPFLLASPLEDASEPLGARDEWIAEWKWDGVRAQLIRRAGATVVWSRGEELLNEAFPELVGAAARLPEGTVLDGELLAYENGRPLPFAALQRRLGRRNVEPTLFPETPVVFMAYDALEIGGADIRERALEERRRMLEEALAALPRDSVIQRSPLVEGADWDALGAKQAESRERGVEGLMLKRRGSAYGVGRTRGDWWKWKVDPFTIDTVLVAAQAGHGRRATLHTDYTLAVWDGDELTTVTKAYSGLTDEEMNEVDRFVRANTLAKHGPVRLVEPRHVFEIAFEGIQASSRHKSGVALRFPRINRWRRDKRVSEADTLETVQALLRESEARAR